MNYSVADPEWGWWIILYFYLGGIAAGAYFSATLIDLWGSAEDRILSRIGYALAFPLIVLCGIFLIVDLTRPERFWHMMFKSEVLASAWREGRWPGTEVLLLKPWSPMSVGSWALSLFGACSALSFWLSLRPKGQLAQRMHHGPLARLFQGVGCLVGFFVAAYTGSLLTATNQPLWSDTPWIASLFLTSAASTALAVMILIAQRCGVTGATLKRLEHADLWVIGLEMVVFAAFLASLGTYLGPILSTIHGKILVLGPLVLGLVAPLAIHLRLGLERRGAAVIAALLVLAGGFLLRYGMVQIAPELVRQGQDGLVHISPEANRPRGLGTGADPKNRPTLLRPRSKVYNEEGE